MGRRITVSLAMFVVMLSGLLYAQSGGSSPSSSDRKVTARVSPVYPELAKKMHLHGIVRVEAIVRPNGTVKTTRILGGNPVLVNAAADAVAKWKFGPSQTETTEVVQLSFDAD